MSRLTVGTLCSLPLLLVGLAKGHTDLKVNITMMTFIAIPLFLHWLFDDKNERNQ